METRPECIGYCQSCERGDTCEQRHPSKSFQPFLLERADRVSTSPIQPSNFHPFDESNSSIPKLNHISPSPVNLPAVIETDHHEKDNGRSSTPAARMTLKGMRRRSSGGEPGEGENQGLPTTGGLAATRPSFLNALSPLQTFSPLHPASDTLSNPSRSRTHSRTPSGQMQLGSVPSPSPGISLGNSPTSTSGGVQQLNAMQGLRTPYASSPKSAPLLDEEKGQGAEGLSRSRSNASSVTRSLSRRQSFAASRASLSEMAPAERTPGAPAFHSHQGGLISKLMIVRAPPNRDAQGEKGKKIEEGAVNRKYVQKDSCRSDRS